LRLTRSLWLLLAVAFLFPAAAFAKARKVSRAELVGKRAVTLARHMVGRPYVYGGSSPRSGFDCSGLVYFVYRKLGVRLPRTSYEQFGVGRRVPRSSLAPGDLVFFNGEGHVGIYIGGGRFIHAPDSGARVRVASLRSPWYRDGFDGARRVGGRARLAA
jgi:cell wall-associated NlpC family hydrolase